MADQTYIVLGATGHVGGAVTRHLLRAGGKVVAVVRDESRAEALAQAGATIAVADVTDPAGLARVLRTGTRAFLLNPPADPATDTDATELASGAAIATALADSGLEKAVAQSTYGARNADRVGDLGTLHAFERRLRAQAVPVTILRAAYYMTNWDALLDAARDGGLPTPLPADQRLPMVAPDDIARAAVRLLREDGRRDAPCHVEGPATYTPNDVADAFAEALGRPVSVASVPRDGWVAMYRELGFSETAARSYARMTAISVDGDVSLPDRPMRGTVTLRDHVAALVRG